MQRNRESKTRSQKAMLAFERYQKKKSVQVQHNRSGFIAIRKYIRPLLRFLLFGQRKIYGFQVEVLKHINFAKNQPVIFAVTHIGKWDFEIVYEKIPCHFYVVASDFINTYGKSGGYFLTQMVWFG